MCGRFTLFTTYEYLLSEFDIQKAFDKEYYEESYKLRVVLFAILSYICYS